MIQKFLIKKILVVFIYSVHVFYACTFNFVKKNFQNICLLLVDFFHFY